MTRKLMLVPVTVIAAVMLLASVAYACTYVGGQTYVLIGGNHYTSGVSVARGGSVDIDAHSVPGYPDYYAGFFLNFKSWQDGMLTCMAKSGYSERRVTAWQYTSDNFISSMTATIPSDAQVSSSALLCHEDDSMIDYATNSATITVT